LITGLPITPSHDPISKYRCEKYINRHFPSGNCGNLSKQIDQGEVDFVYNCPLGSRYNIHSKTGNLFAEYYKDGEVDRCNTDSLSYVERYAIMGKDVYFEHIACGCASFSMENGTVIHWVRPESIGQLPISIAVSDSCEEGTVRFAVDFLRQQVVYAPVSVYHVDEMLGECPVGCVTPPPFE
jgi:hypothetical protein